MGQSSSRTQQLTWGLAATLGLYVWGLATTLGLGAITLGGGTSVVCLAAG
jgi:hypothetical protein